MLGAAPSLAWAECPLPDTQGMTRRSVWSQGAECIFWSIPLSGTMAHCGAYRREKAKDIIGKTTILATVVCLLCARQFAKLNP